MPKRNTLKENIKMEEEMNYNKKSKKDVNSFIKGFQYAVEGIVDAIKSETNMKVHIFAVILVIAFGIILNINAIEWIICVALFAGVIGSELINTAIETVVDMVMPEKNEKAKIAKDVAAGSVLIWAIASAIIGGIIFIPKILEFF